MSALERLMAWCVPDEALHRRRTMSVLEAAKIVGGVFNGTSTIMGTGTMIDISVDHGLIQIPAKWVTGREA